MNARLLLPWLLLLPACNPAVENDEAGFETGPCIDGGCFDGLECLSDVCVGDADTEGGETGSATTPTSASGPGSTTGGPTTDPSTTDDSDPTIDPGTTTDESTTTDPGTTTDEGSTGTTTGTSGCTAIDFLFVVDNSASMEDDQANLIDAFPGFIEGIQNTLESVDGVHVGVVTTDEYMANMPSCNVLGGLVTQTGGASSSNAACGPYAEGANYMTEADDLADSFACAAQVGSSGSGIERPMNAMEAAVGDELGGAGQCNEGFLRDEALLVVVLITDEWDGPNDPEAEGSSGNAKAWHNTVVAAKNGNEENVVVLTLSYINGGACPPPDVFFEPGDIQPFTEMFGDNGIMACITDDFGSTFLDASAVIETACANFVE